MASGGTLPTGVVTFVLTDVVGSTELWDRAPAAMAVAIARHEAIVSEAVTGEGGLTLKTKGEGDSTFSVFARTTDGLRAAYRLQRALRLEPWPPDAPLSTRVAVHTGEAVERDGDYFGPAVNLVARLRGAALGGQVLVSATTATIGRKSLPDGCELVELGPIELRGITDPEVAWALVGPDVDPVHGTAAARSAPDDPGLSRREAEVQSLVAENLTNAEIAARLSVSERTIESLVGSLARKLGAETRLDLVHIAAELATRADGALAPPGLPALLELLADASSFVGRDAERAVLRQQWERACAGHTLLVVVTGEAGIGKSRLVSELAAEVHADGGRVLFGACYEDVDLPYAPFVQAISAEMAGLEDDEARRRAGRDREALARLSPELARSLSVADGRGGVEERGVIVDAIRRWIVSAASSAPSLVVIDDVHWATASTRDVLRDLVRRAGHDPLLVLATTRDTAPDVDAELSVLLADLQRSPATTFVPLGGLEPHHVAALLWVSSAESRDIVAETGGNPLFITHQAAGARIGPLPTLLERRDGLLDEQSRAVLDLAATMGVEFDADVLAVGEQVPLLSVLDSLERAEAAGLVVSLPGSGGRFGFVHALFRAHRYDRLPLRRRLELHAHAATALATRNGRQLSEQARHACLAVPFIDARTAVELARAAGDDAERACAYDEAASHYQRGLEAARSLEPSDPRTSLDLAVRLAAAVHHSDDPRGRAMLIDAADRARREGDTAALVRVATSFSRFGTSGAFAGPEPAQLAVIEDALAALGDEPSPTRALLLVELAAQISGVRVDDALQLAGQAEAIARSVDDPDLLGRVLLGQRLLGHHPSRLEELERNASELEELGRRNGSLALTFIGLYDRAVARLERGQIAMWSQLGEQAAQLLGDRSLIVLQLHARALLATRAFLAGDLDATEQEALSTAPLATAIGHEPLAWSGGILVVNRRLQARDGEMLPVVETIEPRGAFTAARYVLAAMQARVGAVDDAMHTLAALRDDGYPIEKTHPWTLAMSELAEAAEVAGDPDSADHMLAQCSPFTGRIAVAGPCANRPFDQALAQAALAIGDTARAEHYAACAVEASRRRRTPLFLARELVFLAEARRRNGAQSAELRPLVAEALALAHRHAARVVPVDVDRYGLPA